MKGAPLRQTAHLSGLDLLYDLAHPSQFGLPQHQLVLRLYEEKAGQVPLHHGGVKTGSHLLVLTFQTPHPLLQKLNGLFGRKRGQKREPGRKLRVLLDRLPQKLAQPRDHLISVHRPLVEERHHRQSQRIGYLPLRCHQSSLSRYELVEIDYIPGLAWCQAPPLLQSGAIYPITYEANVLAKIMRWSLVEENGSPSKPP